MGVKNVKQGKQDIYTPFKRSTNYAGGYDSIPKCISFLNSQWFESFTIAQSWLLHTYFLSFLSPKPKIYIGMYFPKLEILEISYFPQRAVASWGILNRYWLDPKKSPKCFANLHGLNEVARQKQGYC